MCQILISLTENELNRKRVLLKTLFSSIIIQRFGWNVVENDTGSDWIEVNRPAQPAVQANILWYISKCVKVSKPLISPTSIGFDNNAWYYDTLSHYHNFVIGHNKINMLIWSTYLILAYTEVILVSSFRAKGL